MSENPSLHSRRDLSHSGWFAEEVRRRRERVVGRYVGPGLVESRALLLDVLRELQPQEESLTVVGAHATVERAQYLEDLLETDSTRDADLGVTPQLLLDVPTLEEVMHGLELEPCSPARPGTWGRISDRGRDLHDRLTIDLIAPAMLAGGGRRAARVGVHGKRSVSKTEGTELTTVDRSLMTVRSFDAAAPVEAYVAGHAALVCAKAYKLYDRLNATEFRRNVNRLRPKDAGDIWRLMATSDPLEVKETFAAAEADLQIGAAVRLGRMRLNSIREPLIDLAVQNFRDVLPEADIRYPMLDWLTAFES